MTKLGGKQRNYSWDDSITDLVNTKTFKKPKIKKEVSKKKPVSFSISENLIRDLKNYSYWERQNMSNLVEEMIVKFLKKNGNEKNLKDTK